MKDAQSEGRSHHSTSGDLLADRRFSYGEALATEGDYPAAADLFEQVIERVPDWAPGWLALGLAREKEGSSEAALDACRRAADLDLQGGLGANLHLARLTGRSLDDMPARFVAALFDQYADRFDEHLGRLAYRAPDLIVDALGRVAPGRCFARALDLGCGTGLMARALEDSGITIDGVDLSARMVERARATGHYADLQIGDAVSILQTSASGSYDLVLAADVLVYLGALEPLFAAVAPTLRSDGLLAFTVQRLELGLYKLGADMRFSHAPDYVRSALAEAGLAPLVMEAASPRRDAGTHVPGLVVVARRA